MSGVQSHDPNHTHSYVLAGGGEMGTRMRAHDWAQTALGPVEAWPQSLKTAVRIMLTSSQPMFVWWGDELINLYNDAYTAILGGKHPGVLGQPAAVVWREIWEQVGPRAATAMQHNEGTYDEALLLIMERNGYPEETYYTFSYSPVPNDQGDTGGILCANTDDTQRVIGERQLTLLRELATRTADARTLASAGARSADGLATNPYDLPFALIYLFEPDAQRVVLAGTAGIEAGHAVAPATAALDDRVWPLADVLATGQMQLVPSPAAAPVNLPTGAWERPPQQAVVLPIAQAGRTAPLGMLVVGLNPFRRFDDGYRGFIELVAAQIAASLGNAQAYEAERRRAEELAELDRAKTAFFSNISHEFRTPLTLMLGPAEDALADPATPPANREQVAVIQRNAQRLLKLVNTLLDFSRLEAGRVEAVYAPTDLAALTAELASVFRAAIERAGLALVITCPPLPEPVYVDREMWEKIVFNLLSNAFKFTFSGTIEVQLQAAGALVELTVRDTGTGIPAEELPHLFERFHRVAGARGRTYEGTGIGLALVQELARLHGGGVRVASTVDEGSAFTVTLPLGSAHLPAARIGAARTLASTALHGEVYVEEALRWLPEPSSEFSVLSSEFTTPSETQNSELKIQNFAHILLADDNADMRDYVRRLLSEQYAVEAVPNGAAALAAARAHPPDLVLTDVMMPELDGFGLLRALRDDPRTATVPIIMLSARAGEEARIEGMQAGADDYMVKPFSARELLARVGARLDIARERRANEQAIRASEAQFRQLAESLPQFVWISGADGRLEYVNSQWLAYAGLTLEQTNDSAVLINSFHPDDAPATFAAWEQAQAAGAVYDVKARMKRADDVYRWFLIRSVPLKDAAGRVIKWFGTSTDIHEQEQAGRDAQFLADLAERIRLADDADALLRDIAEHTGAYLDVSRCFFAEVEPERNLVRVYHNYHRDVPSITGSYDLTAFAAILSPTLQAGHTYINCDTARDPETAAFYASAWRPVAVQATVTVPLIRAGRCVAVLSTHYAQPHQWQPREISLLEAIAERMWLAVEKLRADAALRASEERLHTLYAQEQAARQQAEEASRLKDDFLATVSHELRTPLTAILGYGQMLQGHKRDEIYVARTAERIVRSAKSQAQLIEDLLDVSRIVMGKLRLDPHIIDLRAVIHTAIDAVRPALEAKDVSLYTDLDPALSTIMGDPNRLQQVVWNLLSNAAKFTPSGGALYIQLQPAEGDVQISVRDTGQGISAEFLPYVFDRFRQAESSSTRTYGGLGLGLAIVRHLVELHGGTVHVQSDGLNSGATFTVRLPRFAARAEPALLDGVRGVPDAYPPELRGLRVLVVDDQADILELLHDVLAPAGAVVRLSSMAAEALATLRAWQPDVLVSDIAMPGEDGYWLISHVRALAPQHGGSTPAVALTAYVRVEDRARVLQAGFQMYVPKPVEPVELLHVVASLARTPAT